MPSEIVREAAEQAAATAVHTQSAVADGNRKVIAEGTAFFQNQMYAISNAHVNRSFMVAEALLGKIGEMIIETQPAHGLTDLSAGMIASKIGQTVPPISAPPPVTE